MNARLVELLDKCIELYMLSATPISSSNLFKRVECARSPASLRNDLKILEELGYLHQVHLASGGRIPTTRAYKEYVVRTADSTFASEIICDIAQVCAAIERIERKLGVAGGNMAVARTSRDWYSRKTSFQKLFKDPNLQMSAVYLIIKEKIDNGKM